MNSAFLYSGQSLEDEKSGEIHSLGIEGKYGKAKPR
jgi:hypothetical protein